MEIELKVTKQQLMDERNNFKQYESEASDKLESMEAEMKNMERSKESTLMEREAMMKKKILDLES